jgi:LysR family nitrogen assimilation transcriptional regulator
MLEVELRQNLLDRNGRGVKLTESGKLLLEHGRGILHQVEVAREEMGSARGALAGRVSVGLPPSLSRLITVPLAGAQAGQNPTFYRQYGDVFGWACVALSVLTAGRNWQASRRR